MLFPTGRTVAGVAAGALTMLVPLYQSEVASKDIRGRVGSSVECAIAIGVTISTWTAYGCLDLSGNFSWQFPIFLQLVLALVVAIGALLLPVSPRWLVAQGRSPEALKVLGAIRAKGDTTAEHVLRELEEIEMEHRQSLAEDVRWVDLFAPGMRNRLLLGFAISVGQQITGVSMIFYFAPTVFHEAGMNAITALFATGLIGVTNLVAVIPAILFVHHWGRRRTFMSGAAVMGTALVIIGAVMGGIGDIVTSDAGEKEIDLSGNMEGSWSCVAFVYLFVAGYAMSWGPAGYIYPAELLPTRFRSVGSSLAIGVNWLANIVVTQLAPILVSRSQLNVLHSPPRLPPTSIHP